MSQNLSPQTFSLRSYQESESEHSLESLNSVVIEREEPQPCKVSDDIDFFYAQLSMSFYHKNYEKKAPRSAIINSFRNDRQLSTKGKTESLKTHRDFKPAPKLVQHSNAVSRSTAESQNILNSVNSNETLNRKAAEIVNKMSPSVSIYQPSLTANVKKKILMPKRQINEQLLKMLQAQKCRKEGSPSDSSHSLLSQSSFKNQNTLNNCNKLLQLLNSPYQQPISNSKAYQNAQQNYIQKQLNQIMRQQDFGMNQKQDFNNYLKVIKKKVNK